MLICHAGTDRLEELIVASLISSLPPVQASLLETAYITQLRRYPRKIVTTPSIADCLVSPFAHNVGVQASFQGNRNAGSLPRLKLACYLRPQRTVTSTKIRIAPPTEFGQPDKYSAREASQLSALRYTAPETSSSGQTNETLPQTPTSSSTSVECATFMLTGEKNTVTSASGIISGGKSENIAEEPGPESVDLHFMGADSRPGRLLYMQKKPL